MRLGRVAIVTWCLGGFVLLLVATLLQAGPSGWASAWQVRHWGRDNPVLSFVPGFAVLLVPVFVLQALPRRPDSPFLCGAQDALGLHETAPVPAPSSDRMAWILLRFAHGGLVAAGLFLLAGGLGFGLVMGIGNRGAGTPLPELTLAALAEPHAVLPAYARVAGATLRPEATWLHQYVIRRTLYRDAYTPLTGSGWRQGEPVAVLEEERAVAGEDVRPFAGPIEGGLARGELPDWMLGELRRRGVAMADAPVVLIRRDLGGVVPGADAVMAALCLGASVVFALLSLVMSLAWLHRRRRLLRDHATPA